MIELIVSAFNCSDIRLLHGLVSEATIDNVQLTSSTLGCELFGLNPLMVYFGLLLECYPDGKYKYVLCIYMYIDVYIPGNIISHDLIWYDTIVYYTIIYVLFTNIFTGMMTPLSVHMYDTSYMMHVIWFISYGI